ncbi:MULTISPECIES: iron uptake porin [Moorena]|uniref:Carbohydrate-selective porin, OprB family n=1 Tax=Moorena producens 3L TaxID=489825 RepID=F4XYB2_9CYAN|nr:MULTISPECIES: iron uptake porin [Moorena]EGJ30325.1 carbohydrate-selective porin, OprB family [Moorena producens 3L]OLT67652.1 porin [Moorena producens 3L]
MKTQKLLLLFLSGVTGLLLTAPKTWALTDNLQPGSWSYEALRELVEFSGCTTDKSAFVNNEALTRSEFAAILSACQQHIAQTYSAVSEDAVIQHHRARLERLLKDFDAELGIVLLDKIESVNTPTTTNPVSPRVDQLSEPTSTVPELPEQSTSLEPSPEIDGTAMTQVTNIVQLQDVQPGDWAFEALRSLIERYGCIAGYQDRTFQGNRALTRYEFAAGLNACMEQIERLVAVESANRISEEDLATLQQLANQFNPELAQLKTRVDNLDSRVAFLEEHQFSTTVKFGGEVIFGLAAAEGGNPPGTGDANIVLNYLVRIGTVASFTGRDRLRIVLASGNFDDGGFANPNVLNTFAALLSYQDDLDNDVVLDSLEYRFAISDRVVFTIKPVGFSLGSVLTANSPFLDVGIGSISRFGEASPLFKIGALDAGVGLDWFVADPLRLQVAYGTRNSSSPSEGFISPDHSALGVQLLFTPANNMAAGLHYINAYANDGQLNTFAGSFNADTSSLLLQETQTHAVGGSLQWRFTDNLTFAGWGGYTFTNALASDDFANASTYLLSLAFSDPFGQEGSLLGLIIGQPLKLENGNGLLLGEDNATSIHYEIFYRHKFSNNIYITPGFFMVTDPGHIEENNDIYIGVLRATFRF